MSRLEPAHIFEVLNQHGVDYVAIGGVAAIAHGVPRATLDTDVVVAPAPPENHVRLAEALAELDAPTIAQDLMGFIDVDTSDPVDLARGQLIRVPTRWGDLDLVNRAPGAPPYEDLRRRAVRVELGDIQLPIVSLDDLIRLKRASGRPKDIADIADLTRRVE